MIQCPAVAGRLDDYLAGRLAEAEAAAIEEHAGGCDRCAALLEARTRLPVGLPTEIAPPSMVRDAVLAALPRRRRSRLRWLVPPAIAAALVLGFALTHPTPKSALAGAGVDPSAQMAAVRADRELDRLDAARDEIEAALASSPGRVELRDALTRIDVQRRTLERLVGEYQS